MRNLISKAQTYNTSTSSGVLWGPAGNCQGLLTLILDKVLIIMKEVFPGVLDCPLVPVNVENSGLMVDVQVVKCAIKFIIFCAHATPLLAVMCNKNCNQTDPYYC